MMKAMIVGMENTCNPQIPNQYNVKVWVMDGVHAGKCMTLDIRDPNFIKAARRGMIIKYSEIYRVSKNHFIHTTEIEIVTERRNKKWGNL